MIHRFYKDGEKLDVAGLNVITVLIDRVETELTEVAYNEWRAGLEGPPHRHAEKDQVFYIVSGEGKINLGDEEYPVYPGHLIYAPAGLLHRTTVLGDKPLGYIFFNVFNSADKEGHASFADHISKVKEIRRQQAQSGQSDVAGSEKAVSTNVPGRHFSSVHEGKQFDFGSNSTRLLLDRNETNRLEFVVVSWPAGSKGALVAHKEKEQTFFILEGKGQITVGNETEMVKPGEVMFVPRNVPHTTTAGPEPLTYLCLNSLVTKPADPSFEDMVKRIAPERIRRWQSGDSSVGE
jgi:mannose-6-phosphate isomerase-like protein (cupin superfamily)